MGYPPEHRQATRRRILDAAGRLFRKHGYDGAKIDEIMAEAGLTRGGFYLHFESKEALFAAMMGDELEFTRQLRAAGERSPRNPSAEAKRAIDYYLTPRNRAKIASGCTIVSNAADMAKAKPAARRAFTKSFDELVGEFESIAKSPAPKRRQRALAAIATCVGGVVLARALAGEDSIEELLAACRAAVRAELSR